MSAAVDPSAEPSADGGPSRTVEIELKFDVDDSVDLPDWTVLPGVSAVGDPELRDLDALYFDTLDFALAQSGYALRRRLGGPDAGWHIKGPRVRGHVSRSAGRWTRTSPPGRRPRASVWFRPFLTTFVPQSRRS